MDRYERDYDRDYDRGHGRRGFDPEFDRARRRFSGDERGDSYRRDFDRGDYPQGDSIRGYPSRGDHERGHRYESQRDSRYGAYDYEPTVRPRYDRDYPHASPYRGKSQWQRDHGDPFGDRQRGTPIRVIRGDPEWEDRPRGRGRDRDSDYGRDYRSQRLDYGRDFRRDYQAWGFPQQYEPYAPRAGFHID